MTVSWRAVELMQHLCRYELDSLHQIKHFVHFDEDDVACRKSLEEKKD